MIYIYITKNQRETERAPMAASPAPHVVLFPVPGQGHVNPFMAIAEFLAAHGITVTFVHTRRSYAVLTSASSPNLQTLNHHHHHPTASHSDEKNGGCIRIEVVPDAMPADLKQKISSDHLVASMPLMREGLESLLRRLMAVDPNPKNLSQPPPPSCLIADSFMPWSHDVAVQFKLPRIQVWTSSAAVFSAHLYRLCLHLPPPHLPLPPPRLRCTTTATTAPGLKLLLPVILSLLRFYISHIKHTVRIL